MMASNSLDWLLMFVSVLSVVVSVVVVVEYIQDNIKK